MKRALKSNEIPALMGQQADMPGFKCCIRTGQNDLYSVMQERPCETREDLRHYGLCQRVNLYFLCKGEPLSMKSRLRIRHSLTSEKVLLVDMHHARLVEMIDLTSFDGKPGCFIRIAPVPSVKFTKVTVCIIDFYGNELVHDHASPGIDPQEWVFVYFPKRRTHRDPGNLKVVIRASCRPRDMADVAVDPYELPPDCHK
jgi:hypothetical protein